MQKQFLYAAAFFGLLSVGGCTTTVSATGTTGCTVDNTLSCSGGTGYQCGGSARPNNQGQVCNTDGTGLWCCYVSTCNPDSTIAGCVAGSYGYSCSSGQPAPDAADSSLICSIPTRVTGLDEYCCATSTPVSNATCSLDQSVQGCPAGSYGFSCTGTDRPDTDYSGITCSAPTASAAATLYCCTYNGTTTTVTPVTCNLAYQEAAGGPVCGSTCDACLQTYECVTQYKACDSTCQSQIEAMKACTKAAADANGGTLLSNAESTCSTSNLGGTSSAAYALWWEVIRLSLDCTIPCCATF